MRENVRACSTFLPQNAFSNTATFALLSPFPSTTSDPESMRAMFMYSKTRTSLCPADLNILRAIFLAFQNAFRSSFAGHECLNNILQDSHILQMKLPHEFSVGWFKVVYPM